MQTSPEELKRLKDQLELAYNDAQKALDHGWQCVQQTGDPAQQSSVRDRAVNLFMRAYEGAFNSLSSMRATEQDMAKVFGIDPPPGES
jgi:hypothetical protein